jgi:hypothetical protein
MGRMKKLPAHANRDANPVRHFHSHSPRPKKMPLSDTSTQSHEPPLWVERSDAAPETCTTLDLGGDLCDNDLRLDEKLPHNSQPLYHCSNSRRVLGEPL